MQTLRMKQTLKRAGCCCKPAKKFKESEKSTNFFKKLCTMLKNIV